MVKKLMKYELLSYVRSLAPMGGIVLGVALLARIVRFFANDSVTYLLISRSSATALYISNVVFLVMAAVAVITRYYKNLFTAEGYLTLTLPVTETQHLGTKLAGAMIAVMGSILTVLLGFCITTSGVLLREIFQVLKYQIRQICRDVPPLHFAFYVLEGVILFLAIMAMQILIFYFCMSFGQLARKNRILAAFATHFGLYLLVQLLGTALNVVYVMGAFENVMRELRIFEECHPYAFVHILMVILIFVAAAIGAGGFFASRYIIRKKLNLE